MKCILLSRVSTDRQSLEAQTKELLACAKFYGYSKRDIILIEDKESAIKLSEEERSGLNRMKEIIDSPNSNVDCVMCYEISRIGRTMKVLMSIKDYLVERKIQLRVMKPTLYLLEKDGSVNLGLELAFTLYAQMCAQEMYIKKERFRRTKADYAIKGKYNGGPHVRYGYSIDADGYYVVNEAEAEVIRLIYKMYIGGLGSTRIFLELDERGIRNRDGVPFSRKFIMNVLRNRCYLGEEVNEWGFNRIYPQIVSVEDYEAARLMKEHNQREKLPESFDWRLCKKLIVCPECGRHFVWWRRMRKLGSYSCVGKDVRKYGRNKPCHNSTCITDTWIESLAFQTSVYHEAFRLQHSNTEEIQRLKDQIEATDQKIETAIKELEKIDSAIERTAEMYYKGYIDSKKMDALGKRSKEERREKEKFLSNLRAQKKVLERTLEEADVQEPFHGFGPYEMQMYQLDQKSKYELVHRHIKQIRVTDSFQPYPGRFNNANKEGNYGTEGSIPGSYKCKEILIEFFDGATETYWFFGGIAAKCDWRAVSPFTTIRDGELKQHFTLKLEGPKD